MRNVVIGPFDPHTGLTTLALEVEVFDAAGGDRVVLERNGVPVFESILSTTRSHENEARRASVVVERQIEGIPAGVGGFTLVLRRGVERLLLWSGEFHVRYLHPEINLECISTSLVRSGRERPTYRVYRDGLGQKSFSRRLPLPRDRRDPRAAVIGLHELRPDVARAMQASIVSRQGFDASVDITDVPPGEHVVHLIATQRGGGRSRVSRRVVFEEPPVRRLTVISDDLERLKRGEQLHFYSSISIRGVIHSRMEEAVATLLVDDRLADEQPFEAAGRHEFRLRAVPKASGEYEVRFHDSRRAARVVLSTEPVRVSFPVDSSSLRA